MLKYSRDAEREADRNAVEITYAAELNPSGIVKFFDKLQRQKDQKDSQISTQIQKLISSHPLTSERISNVKKLISEFPVLSVLRKCNGLLTFYDCPGGWQNLRIPNEFQ